MKITSALTPKDYIAALKKRMHGHFELGQERYTGFFLGRLFTVTHHSAFEWNRRVTNEKSTALGYVKKTEEGCQVCFITLRGMLAPTQFLLYLAILLLFSTIGLLGSGKLAWEVSFAICFVTMLVCAPISAFCESLTEKGQEGMHLLLGLMMEPRREI